MANFFESLWNEIKHPSTTGTGDVDDRPVDRALIRRMGLTYKGLDENGNKVWEDDAGHQYTAAQLQQHDDDESQASGEPLMGDPAPYPQTYYSGTPRYTNPVTDTGGVTSKAATYPENDTRQAWVLQRAKDRIKKDAEGEIKKAVAEGKAIRINVENRGVPGDKDNSFYYQEQTPGEGGGLLIVNITTDTDKNGNVTTGYVSTSTSTTPQYGPPGDIEGATPTSGSGTGGSTGGTGTDPSGGGSGSGGTGTGPSGGGDSSGGSSSHDDDKDCDCKKPAKNNKPETNDRKNDPKLVTYTDNVTKKLKDEVTDSAEVVKQSPATRSPAIYETVKQPSYNSPPQIKEDKKQKLIDDYTQQKEDAIKKQAPKDAPVVIRFRFKDDNSDGSPTIIEKELKTGNPKENTWVYVVDVVGLTDNGGLVFSGSIIGHWVIENSNPPINPVSPAPLQLFPVRPPEPPKPRSVPNIHLPPPPPPPLPIPVPAPYKPTIVPFNICYDCFAGNKNDHVDRDANNIDKWLKANPDYNLVVYADADAANGSAWDSIVGGKTVYQILQERYAHFFSDLLTRFKYMASRITLKKRNATGRVIELLPVWSK